METINPIARQCLLEAAEDPEGFWARAADQLPWFRKWDRVLEWEFPTFRWFIGAQTNLAFGSTTTKEPVPLEIDWFRARRIIDWISPAEAASP